MRGVVRGWIVGPLATVLLYFATTNPTDRWYYLALCAMILLLDVVAGVRGIKDGIDTMIELMLEEEDEIAGIDHPPYEINGAEEDA